MSTPPVGANQAPVATGPLRPVGVHPVTLRDACRGAVGVRLEDADAERTVTGISLDSRSVAPGELYVALRGLRVHGADYARMAAERGAVAALTDAEGADRCRAAGLATVVADDPRLAMAQLSAAIFPQAVTVVGITGTNGKTTTAFIVEAGLRAAGHRVGTIGTNGFRLDGVPLESAARTTVTTPEAPDLMALLAVMAERGADVVVMEVSSHALALHRVDGVHFAVGAFLNLGRDHLDFHPTMHDYFEAKARLFEPGRCDVAIINTADEHGRTLAERVRGTDAARLVSFGGEGADYRADTWTPTATGSHVVADTPAGPVVFDLLLPGSYNVANALAALATCVALGVDADVAVPGLSEAVVPGRMQPVPLEGAAPRVFVDFAHTPQAIESALAALPEGHPVVAVIGAGGDRDREKRGPMGRAAAAAADVVVVTDDNPRSEDPAAIRAQVSEGARGVRDGVRVVELSPRDAAIREALRLAAPDGVVAVLGKGHEQGQQVADRMIAFDDVTAVRDAWQDLAETGGPTRDAADGGAR